MATSRYSTSVSLCEDTSKNFELFDLLKQADPNYSATEPARIKLYVFDGSKYVEATSGYFTSVDKDTFTVDMSYLPNFNGDLKVRVLGTDSTGNSFVLDLTINVTPVNDAPSGADESLTLANGDLYVLGLNDFGFSDPVEGDSLQSVVITTLPATGSLLLDGVAVMAGQEVLAADIVAGKLTYTAPLSTGGAIGFEFQVRDTGGIDGCGGNDLDLTPNVITFNVPQPSQATLGDTVFEDKNANGVQDAGEAGIANVTVQLKDAGGNVVQTATTDTNGHYSFSVTPGTYSVAVVKPAGYEITGQDLGGNEALDSDINAAGQTAPVTLVSGENNPNVDAGFYRLAELGDKVWYDTNKNGVQDGGEAGVTGVKVSLLDAAGNVVTTQTTDAAGNYLFTNLKPGTYSVQFDKATLPTGYVFTSKDVGSDAADSDADSATGKTIQTVLDSGESDKSWDAGIVANPGSISGTVREDLDNNNTGDTPIAGVTVQLKDPAGNVVQTTTTDTNGNYTFSNVPAGTYTVVETNKPGFSDVSDIDGGNPNSIAVTLAPGANSTGNDFVDERLPGVVSGSVLEDGNNDNVGDTPIPGVTVELKDPAGNVVQTTTTDANGNYTFNNVPAGNYTVVESNKPGYTDVGDTDGGNPNTIAVTVTPGSSSTGNVFVDERPATLGDTVFEDKNANGVQDAGEAGIANVTVQLKDAGGNVVQTATTDTNGHYSFSVTPGTYSVAVVKPAGYEITGQDLGGNEALDSDINAAGQTAPVTLVSGENNPNVDAGFYRLAELGDKVWYDTNKNGVQDGGEAGVTGVKVSLLDAAGNVVTTQTTDAAGNYLFTNLKPGTYSVQFDKATLPTGYVFTSKDVGSDAADSDADSATGKTIQTVLDSGESDKSWDAGIVANPGSISGTVREDLDNNNTGDTPIAGVTVQLKDPAGNVVQTTTTDTNGNYTFSNVPAGTYTVVETNKPGFSDVSDIDGGNPNSIAVTLAPGANSTGNDFVDERLPGVVSGSVLEDGNNDNVGDTPIPGVTVELKDPAGNVVQTTTTDANGNYTFNNVPAGNYTVVESNKPGYTDVGDTDGGNPNTIAVTVTPGSSSTGNVFVDERPATLGDTVFEDKNANGVQDAGEAGIANVTVQLKDAGGNVVQSATTDTNGNYSFSVTPGTYSVAVVKPAGYEITGQDLGGNEALDSDINAAGQTAPVTLVSGENNPNVDAGFYRLAELGDKVWYDTNKNGVQDGGEAGVTGVKVSLLDAAGNVVTTQTTDAAGNYLFTNLKPGTYSVQFDKATLPTGYVFTSKDVGSDAADSDADSATGKTIQTVLDSGESDKSWDAGIVANPGSISGTVREDLDNNNTGDTPIAGVTVQLKDPAGNVVQTTTTDTNGNYTFSNVPAGTYTVVETNKPGFSDVSDIDGGNPNSIAVTLAPGANSTGNDFVDERLPGVVSGSVLEDGNNDNVGDTPIPGVTVELKDPAGNVVQTTTTDANGNYTFNNVPAGNYTVVESNKPGYTDVGDTDGGNPNTIAVTVTPGSSSTGNVFVDERPATLGDTVFEDKNANGVQDAGEAGIANVTVQLKDAGGNVVQSATTDTNGNYSFSVTPGTYSVAVVKPAGYEITGQDLGGNEALDSDINAAGQTAPVTLVSGENNPNVDAGFYRLAELGDKVWYDTNKNGVQDGGEAGVTGVKVSLLDAAGNVVTTQTTDAAGNYLFTNLKPGTYSVQFDKATLPTGYVFTSKDVGSDAADSDADSATGKTIQTVLDSGESDKSWDAGIVANPGSISGTVREDLDNNNTGDTPIAGVTVQLKDPAGNVVQTTTTDTNGNYTFSNVPAGTYTVVETNKPGFSDVSDIDGGNPNSIAVTLAPGANSTGNDFVDERLPGVVSGSVLEDGNNDNVGDTPIPGVTVELKDPAGNVVQTTTTDANGNYTFNNVPAGNYTVVESNKPGYTDVGDTDGGNPNTIAVTVTPGSSSTGNVFVDERPATLGDTVFEDKNANGVQDAGEAGIANVTVQLKDAGGNVVQTATTDTNGHYSFSVTPGTYSVAVVKPAGYEITGQDLGGNEALDSDINAAGQTAPVTLVSGENNPNVDAGFYRLAELGDKVWYDTNKNGVQDGGEAGVTGVKVSLLDAAGNVVTTQTTDAAGNYLFTNLKPGTYSVQFDKATLPTGYVFTSKDVGSDAADSDADSATGKTIQTVLDSGESDKSWDAGIVANPGSISGTVREDLDNNNTGDTPIAGVTVVLKDSAGNVVQTTTTGVDGTYTFNNVPAGTYTVVETNKPGYLDVSDIDGGNPNSIAVTLTPGTSSTGNDFVDERTAAIGDKVWLDKNANGVQDAGEAGLAGVTVKLLDSAGNVVGSSTTDANGNYLFSSLTPGDYAVQVVAPTGYTVTGKDLGGNDATDSDIDPTTGKTINTTLSAGETDLTWDAGLYQKASIGDKVWLDANKNGVQDTGEAGITGVTVKLLNAAGTVVATATTDANGNYLFKDLVPGDYSVQVVAPTGYAFTGKDLGGNDATDSDVDQATGKTITTTLESGENDLSWDAGLTKPTAAYGDKVWLDKNANGVQDAGEAGLAGVTVKLLNSAGTVVSTTTTDANGNYLFDNLTPGDYSAQVVAPTGYFVSPKDQGGNDATDSDFDPTTGKTISTTLTDGEKDLSWDAGLYQKASIGDKVWADCNNNGIQDGTEAGVPGVTVKLLNAAGTVVATTLTDGNGNYVFKDLMPGTYSVQFVAPTGYLFTTKDVGTNDAIDSDVGNSVVLGTTNLITNGSFESGTTGWTGNCDSVEVNTAGAFGVSAVTGAMVAELDANTAGAGTGFYQDVATVTGQAYQLTVDLAQRAGYAASTNTVEIWWDGAKIATIDPTSTALTKYTFDVVAKDASSRVEFREQTGDDDSVGGIIDNVRLVTSGTAGGAVGTTIQTTLESGENDLTWDAGLTVKQVTATFDFSGNSATDGTDGNVLCFSNNGISVNASAFSRDKTATTWAKAFLGSYAGGLGVTDGSEGSGSGSTHTVDNNGTRDNYVLFEFSQSVVVDKAYLGYVVGDSDAKVWIGTVNGAFDSHITLSDAVLSSMGFVEVNATTLTSARWADLNAAGYVGNVLIVSADVTGTECDDYFKIQNLVVSTPNAFCATDVSIGDRVWNDANANGVQDAGEAGIAGVTVKLLNSAGAVITTTTTDANGNYLFDKLAAGDYKVQVVTPTGYVVTTKDASVATDATDSDIDASGISGVYTLSQGSNNLTVDAGLYCPPSTASIGDKVWLDSNKNGIQDAGEAGYCGATVKLLNAAGTVVATTTTDINGNYKFSNVAPGDYSVQVVAPSGYVFSAKDQGTNDAVDSDVDTSTGKTITTTLVAGENDLTWDAGIYCPPTTASIGDKVWEDANYNGVQDTGEAGIKGVTVKLLNSYGTVVATTTTDASGNYLFSNVNVGNYKVQVVAPTGYYYTKQNQGTNDAIDSDVDSSGKTAYTSLTAGESDKSWDAGLYRKASIGDKVWEDSNHNNLQDFGEAGICNVKVSLQNSAGTTIASTYTDAYGNYKFTNLDPGSYRVVFDKSATVYKYTDMSNWDWAAKDIGTDDTRDADAYSYGDVATTAYTTLVSGEADLTWDAAITPIVLDLDHNGIQTIAREDSTGKFDLFGNGQAIESGWISSGDAFLAIDIDKNGKIDNLSELFGGTSKGDGFAKLGAFDSNGDGFVDAKDAHFSDLRVWQDLNGNHQTDAGELRTLAEAGVASLKVDHVDLPAVDAQGNLHLERSSAVMTDGSSIDMADVYFNVSVADAEAAGVELPNLSALLGDDRSLDLVLGSSAVTASATTEASASATVCDGAVTALSQLANLYDEQQFALMAA